MDWIIHLDTDELLYPGGAAEYSVRRLLSEVPHDVDMVIFPNYVSKQSEYSSLRYYSYVCLSTKLLCCNQRKCLQESSVERDNIKDPFSEVSPFFIIPSLPPLLPSLPQLCIDLWLQAKS